MPASLGKLTNMTRISLHMLEVRGDGGYLMNDACACLQLRSFDASLQLRFVSPSDNPPKPEPTRIPSQLETLPPELGAISQMEAASIFKCRLTAIPGPMLAGWKVCRRLALYENQLRELPEEIGEMEGLQEL